MISWGLMVSSAMSSPAFKRWFNVLTELLSRRWLTEPSITVSPTRATIPPITEGSTTVFTSTSLPVAGAQGGREPGDGRVVEFDRRAHLGDGLVPVAGGPGRHAGRRWRGGRRPAPRSTTKLDQAHRQRRRLAAEQVVRRRPSCARRGAGGSVRALAELGRRLEGAGDPEQLVADALELALGPGDLEDRCGVAVDAVVGGHARLIPLQFGDVLVDQRLLGLGVHRPDDGLLGQLSDSEPTSLRIAAAARSRSAAASSRALRSDLGGLGLGLGDDVAAHRLGGGRASSTMRLASSRALAICLR